MRLRIISYQPPLLELQDFLSLHQWLNGMRDAIASGAHAVIPQHWLDEMDLSNGSFVSMFIF